MRVSRALTVVLSALLAVGWPVVGVVAQEEPESFGLYDRVELAPSEGTVLSWGGQRLAGRLEVRGNADGLVVVEHVAPEDYLLGIQEVPFSWAEEALKAQVVAARTYLAWTLGRGRSGAGSTYGFDICASAACQVYRGLDQVEGPEGQRWEAAVRATDGEILLYNGEPAQALYSSTTGGRTRAVQDVFGGTAWPYLQAVESPGEPSPFVDWTVEIPRFVLEKVLTEAEELAGRLRGVEVETTDDGTGPWTVRITGDQGVNSLTTWGFRGVMNRWGPTVAPDLLPAERPDGRRYPQTVLSPTYGISKAWRYPEDSRSGFVVFEEVYTVTGHGWGHLVGMSQYGALAMAESGSTHDDILAHYYGGLRPISADEALPQEVSVGLAWEQGEVVISADGPISVSADGTDIAADALGSWRFQTMSGDVATYPPEGLGLPPALRDLDPVIESSTGQSVVIAGTLAAAAEVRLVVFRGPQIVGETPWQLREAGNFAVVWDGTAKGEIAPPAHYRVLIEARSPEGTADSFLTAQLRDTS